MLELILEVSEIETKLKTVISRGTKQTSVLFQTSLVQFSQCKFCTVHIIYGTVYVLIVRASMSTVTLENVISFSQGSCAVVQNLDLHIESLAFLNTYMFNNIVL